MCVASAYLCERESEPSIDSAADNRTENNGFSETRNRVGLVLDQQ